MQTTLPVSPMRGIHTVELTAERAPLLQKFFEENPAYFLATSGEPAGSHAGVDEITSELPAEMSCTKKWVIGYVWANARLIAMASVYHGGGSVASSLFVLKGLCGITGARGEAYFTSTDEGQSPRQYRVSFPKRPASSERASPDKKVFALAECAMFKF